MQKLILITDDDALVARATKRCIVSALKKLKVSDDIRDIHVEDGPDATVKAYVWLLKTLSRALDKHEDVSLLLITDCDMGTPDAGPKLIVQIRNLKGCAMHFKSFTALLMSGDHQRGAAQAAVLSVPFLGKPMTTEIMDLLWNALQNFMES